MPRKTLGSYKLLPGMHHRSGLFDFYAHCFYCHLKKYIINSPIDYLYFLFIVHVTTLTNLILILSFVNVLSVIIHLESMSSSHFLILSIRVVFSLLFLSRVFSTFLYLTKSFFSTYSLTSNFL